MEQWVGQVLAVTADVVLARHVLSVTAAVDVEAVVEVDVEHVRSRWRDASIVLVGVDRAAEVVALSLPRRSAVYVLGTPADRDETHLWSARLGAAVITLPDGAGDLAAAIADLAHVPPNGQQTWCVLGGSGGVGASTLAAGLAVTAARSGMRALLVDADPGGGGIDLLLGAEHLPGWRWPRLSTARGHLGDLAAQLPEVAGVALLSTDRADRQPIGALALDAVLSAGARSHDLTVVDLPRHLDEAAEAAVQRADQVLLVVRADVRGVAAAGQVAELVQPFCPSLTVVVRLGRSRSLSPESVADALALRLAGSLTEDAALVGGAERGVPPGHAARGPFVRACRQLLGSAPVQARAA